MAAKKFKVFLEDYWLKRVYTVNIKNCAVTVVNLYYKEEQVCSLMYRNDGYSDVISDILQIHVMRMQYILDSITLFVCQTFAYTESLPFVSYYNNKSVSEVCSAFVQLLMEYQYLYEMLTDTSVSGVLFNWNNNSLLSNGTHKNSIGWLFVPYGSDIRAIQCSMFAVYALPVRAKACTIHLRLIDVKRGIVQALDLNMVKKCK